MTSLFSCGVDRWPEYYKWTGRDLWIDSVMREEYLWFEDIPDSKNVNYFLAPEAFLKSIRSSLDKDYSSVDTLYATPTPSYGFDYSLYRISGNDTVSYSFTHDGFQLDGQVDDGSGSEIAFGTKVQVVFVDEGAVQCRERNIR